MSNNFIKVAAVLALTGAGAVRAGLIDTRQDLTAGGATVDGVIGANEYGPGNAYSYGGGGGGFGGTVGNGRVYLESDAANLYVGFQPGADLNDLAFLMIDSRTGGFVDAQMADRGDGGRRAVTEHTLNVNDPYDPEFLPDFGLVIGNFGIVLFELAAGNTDFYLPFVSFDGTFNGNAPTPREYAIPLSTLGGPSKIDFFMGYVSDSGYNSNESIPAFGPLNGFDNPGFDGASAGYGNYNRFMLIPEPGSLALLGLGAGALVLLRRRG